jgi:hypothetical protein
MSEPTLDTGAPSTELAKNRQLAAALLGEQDRMQKFDEQLATSQKVLADQCAYLLQTALNNSRLPETTQARIKRQYEGQVFQLAALQTCIEEAREEIASITAAVTVQGPGRITGMSTSKDQVVAAVDDLLGAPRDAGSETLKTARLSGIC